MSKKILISLAAFAFASPFTAVAAYNNSSTETSSSNFFNNNLFEDTYISIGYGKSLPTGKVSLLSFNDNDDEAYYKRRGKNSNTFKASFGKRTEFVRVEFEFLYNKKHKLDFLNITHAGTDVIAQKLHTSHSTFFLNTYYDFKNVHTNIKPYVGVGLGISRNKISAEKLGAPPLNTYTTIFKSNKKSANSFAWNASLGLIIDINERLFLDFSYKYVDLGKVKGRSLVGTSSGALTNNNNIKGRFRNNVFLVSAGIKF